MKVQQIIVFLTHQLIFANAKINFMMMEQINFVCHVYTLVQHVPQFRVLVLLVQIQLHIDNLLMIRVFVKRDILTEILIKFVLVVNIVVRHVLIQ